MTTQPTFTPAAPQYPDVHVQLSGEDGNAFAIIGRVRGAIRRQIGPDAATRYAEAATRCESYDALLQFTMSTVDVS